MNIGVVIMALFGAAWCGWGLWLWSGAAGPWLAIPVLVAGALLVGQALVRRVPVDPAVRKRAARMFGIASAGEGVMLGVASGILYGIDRFDLAPHAMAAIVGLHFIPPAWLIPAHRYFAVAAASLLLVIVATTALNEPLQAIAICLGMAILLWTAAASLVISPVGRATRDTQSV